MDQPEQNVLGADKAVVQETRFLLRQHQHPSCPVGEAFEHLTASLSNSYFSLPAGPCPIGGRSFVAIILGSRGDRAAADLQPLGLAVLGRSAVAYRHAK